MIDYTTLAAVKSYGDTKKDDAIISTLITDYSRQIDTFCNQRFSFASYTDQAVPALVDESGVLVCWPAVPSLTVAFASYSPSRGQWQAFNTNDVEVEPHSCGAVVRGYNSGLSRGGRQSMRLTYIGGWADLSQVPADFQLAALRLVWWGYKLREAPISKTAGPDFGSVVIPPNGWPRDIKDALRPYVRQVPL